MSLRVRDGVLMRTLARVPETKQDGTQGEARFEGAQAEALTQIYGDAKPDGSFTGRFTSSLPADLGGSGELLRRTGPLGTVYRYHERTKGTDAPLAALSEHRKGVEESLALTEGWLATELGSHPAAAVLDAWLRERVIPDLAELATYGWLGGSGLIGKEELELRSQQFLLERDYLDTSDPWSQAEIDVFWSKLMRRVLQRGGISIDAELETKLARLDTLDEAFGALQRHIARSERFRTWLATRAASAEEAPLPPGAIEAFLGGEESPEAKAGEQLFELYLEDRHEAATALLRRAFFGASTTPEARVDVTLALPAPPIDTNGTWTAEPPGLVWKEVPLQSGSELSALLYATWTEPNIEYQVEHFGRTILRGKALLVYEDWRRDLDAEDRRIWDELVDLLRPGPELRARIEAMRLPEHRAPETTEPEIQPEPEKDLPPRGVELLLEAVGGDVGGR